MTFIQHYDSPLGAIFLAADDVGLTGLWFEGQKYFAATLPAEVQTKETPALREGRRWLDLYFAGKEPVTSPPLHLIGTPFRLSVWKILSEIPYGKTTTYGDIAQRLAQERGLPRLSARLGRARRAGYGTRHRHPVRRLAGAPGGTTISSLPPKVILCSVPAATALSAPAIPTLAPPIRIG